MFSGNTGFLNSLFERSFTMTTAIATRKPRRSRSLWGREPFAALREELNEFRTRLMGDEEEWFEGAISPSLDLSETDTAVEVRMDLPGIKSNDIDIQLNDNFLTISGKRAEEKEEKGKTYHRLERRSGSFSRSVTLPCAVVEDKVTAEFHDGVLTVSLPKSEEAKAHKITVKS
jgi:HSP20 family protein